MERNRNDAGRPRRHLSSILPVAALLLLFSTGCLKVDASLSVSQNSSVRLRAAYSISSLAFPLFSEKGGGFSTLPPLSRTELETLVSRIPGTRILSYAETSTALDRSYDVSLDFPSPDSLCSFLKLTAGNAVFRNENGKRTLTIEIPCPAARADQELVSSLDVLYGDYAIRLKTELSVQPISAPSGKIAGKSATFEIKLLDLVTSGKNALWVLSW